MNGQTALILMITALILTTGGIVAMQEVLRNMQGAASVSGTASSKEFQSEDIVLVNTVGTSISNNSYGYAQIEVRYEGDEAINLNNTFIQIETERSIADLQYRNGTLSRDPTTGFYTE